MLLFFFLKCYNCTDPTDKILDDRENGMKWRERLAAWKEILSNDNLAENIDSMKAKYVVDFDMQEVEKSLREQVMNKAPDTLSNRALWISKRWWRYRPKLPYTYFLNKLNSSEVLFFTILELTLC